LGGLRSVVDWEGVFDQVRRERGAVEDDIVLLVESLKRPISMGEIAEINANQQNPFDYEDELHSSYSPFDPSRWRIPEIHFPEDYLDLLRWCNGGSCVQGDREISFLATNEVREYLLSYHFPEYMPGAVPLGLNGGGVFYVFDARLPPEAGEYPIIASEAGVMTFEDSAVVARSFGELCRGRVNIEEILYGRS
jgi:hypothetical protein